MAQDRPFRIIRKNGKAHYYSTLQRRDEAAARWSLLDKGASVFLEYRRDGKWWMTGEIQTLTPELASMLGGAQFQHKGRLLHERALSDGVERGDLSQEKADERQSDLWAQSHHEFTHLLTSLGKEMPS